MNSTRTRRASYAPAALTLTLLAAILIAALFVIVRHAHAQTPTPTPAAQAAPAPAAAPAGFPSAADRAAQAAASTAEREREMKVLGIAAMQPGVTAYDIGKPGNANYDESKANPYPNLPKLLVFNNGKPVKTAADWAKRRKEISAMFDEYVYGKYPAHIPSVTWTVTGTEESTVADIPVIVKHVLGHTDNSSYPAITVDMHIDVVTPAGMKGKRVPVIIGGGSIRRPGAGGFGGFPGARPGAAGAARPARPTPPPGTVIHGISMPPNPPDSSKLLLEAGMGFVSRSSNEVQADNGAGLTKGIIGLVNKGQPRSVDDWGVLRAWAWGDARIVDYLLTDPDVDGSKIGVFGHSRGGKAALVAEVDDPRIAIGYISSSGAGGAALFRRNYGETTSSITSTTEFHWFCGNFLKYGSVGHTANELPVDSHEFIALAAPRAVFIGGGALLTDPKYVPGDAWQDAQGMFMAAAAASPAWTILGHKGLGTDVFPPQDTFIDTGDIAFRQHDYGHTPAPNWPYFIEFAKREFAKGN
ncbi:MAG TPA: hypothetical protein VN612_09305 [Acidobacteriaceae bacterium]|nr:hypothetical protein [Acidobacteriaceae bacterium]